MLSRHRRLFRRAILGVTVALSLANCSVLPRPATVATAAAPHSTTLYVVGRGWHTDIGLSVADISGPLSRVALDFPAARTLVFGFGDRHYLLTRQKNFAGMLAALIPGPGALLVTGLSTMPDAAFGATHVVPLSVDPTELSNLLQSLNSAFDTLPDGVPRIIAGGPYRGSLFYASTITYSGYYTCNTWTVDTLASAGLPVSPLGVLFAGQVMHQAKAAAGRQRNRRVIFPLLSY